MEAGSGVSSSRKPLKDVASGVAVRTEGSSRARRAPWGAHPKRKPDDDAPAPRDLAHRPFAALGIESLRDEGDVLRSVDRITPCPLLVLGACRPTRRLSLS